jgi:hypothetical protein
MGKNKRRKDISSGVQVLWPRDLCGHCRGTVSVENRHVNGFRVTVSFIAFQIVLRVHFPLLPLPAFRLCTSDEDGPFKDFSAPLKTGPVL